MDTGSAEIFRSIMDTRSVEVFVKVHCSNGEVTRCLGAEVWSLTGRVDQAFYSHDDDRKALFNLVISFGSDIVISQEVLHELNRSANHLPGLNVGLILHDFPKNKERGDDGF